MTGLVLGTAAVSMDEACFSLKEILEPAADSRSVRRIQTIKVIRNDRIAEFRRDLGNADDFTAGEFVIPGGIRDERTGRIYVEETVGSLMEIADTLRSDKYEPPEPPQGIDLIKGYHDKFDKQTRNAKGQTTFGHGGWTQRSS